MGTVTLFSLAFPMFLENIIPKFINTVNTSLLSNYSETAVAAIGTAGTAMGLVYTLSSVIGTGSTVVISNYIGRDNREKIYEATFSSIAFCVGFGIISSVFLTIFSEKMLGFMNLKGETYEIALYYFKYLSKIYFISATVSALLAVMRCFGYPKYTVFVSVGSGLLNMGLVFYFLYFPKYAPVTGIKGLCVAQFTGTMASLIASIIIFRKIGIKIKVPNSVKNLFVYMWKMVKIGFPTAISNCSVTVSSIVTTSFIAFIGTYALSARTYYDSLLSYAYLFSMIVGCANALLTGRLCGAKKYEEARRMNRSLVKITMAVNLSVSVLLFALRAPLLSLFTKNQQIIYLSFGIFLIDIITEQARAVSQIYEYSLRAAGDITVIMVVTVISCWVFAVGLSYLLSIKCGLGLIGCYIGIAFDEITRTVVSLIRWRQNKWTKKLVI